MDEFGDGVPIDIEAGSGLSNADEIIQEVEIPEIDEVPEIDVTECEVPEVEELPDRDLLEVDLDSSPAPEFVETEAILGEDGRFHDVYPGTSDLLEENFTDYVADENGVFYEVDDQGEFVHDDLGNRIPMVPESEEDIFDDALFDILRDFDDVEKSGDLGESANSDVTEESHEDNEERSGEMSHRTDGPSHEEIWEAFSELLSPSPDAANPYASSSDVSLPDDESYDTIPIEDLDHKYDDLDRAMGVGRRGNPGGRERYEEQQRLRAARAEAQDDGFEGFDYEPPEVEDPSEIADARRRLTAVSPDNPDWDADEYFKLRRMVDEWDYEHERTPDHWVQKENSRRGL